MGDHEPARKKQLFFAIDEVYDYLPSRAKPGSKIALHRLLDQGRGLGIICGFCSNKTGELDYNVMEQANLWVLGNMRTPSNMRKIRALFSEDNDEMKQKMQRILHLRPGELRIFFENRVHTITELWQLFSVHTPVNRDTLHKIHRKTVYRNWVNRQKQLRRM